MAPRLARPRQGLALDLVEGTPETSAGDGTSSGVSSRSTELSSPPPWERPATVHDVGGEENMRLPFENGISSLPADLGVAEQNANMSRTMDEDEAFADQREIRQHVFFFCRHHSQRCLIKEELMAD